MKTSLTNDTGDIATEKYAGPSARVEAAGRGFLEHLAFAFSGLAIFGTLAFIFHQPAARLVEKSRALGTRVKNEHYDSSRWGKAKDSLTNWYGGFLHLVFGDVESAQAIKALSKNTTEVKHADWLNHVAMNREQGFGNAFLSHTIGLIPLAGKPFIGALKEATPRWQTAIAVGGFAGALGYVGGWLKAAVLGATHGNRGKTQLERAQREIHALREKNEDLEKVHENLRKDYVEASSRLKDAETNTPTTGTEDAAKATHASAEKPGITKLESAEHKGVLHPERQAEIA